MINIPVHELIKVINALPPVKGFNDPYLLCLYIPKDEQPKDAKPTDKPEHRTLMFIPDHANNQWKLMIS